MAKNNKLPTKLFLFLPLLTIVLISGCTAGPGIGAGGSQGVAILEWVPDFTQADSFDTIQILLRVRNLGGAEARNVEAILDGITPEEWGVFNERILLGDLLPADPRYNTEGQEKTAIVTLEAPELTEGIFHDFHPRARVAYEYSTVAAKTITIVGETDLSRLELQGGTLPTTTTSVTGGPIAVDINVGNLIKASQTGTRNTEFPIEIDLRNVGGGTIQENDPVPGNELQFVASVKLDLDPGLRFADSDCLTMDRVTFWRGQDAQITCNIEITDSAILAQEKLFKIELAYEYFVDIDTLLTIRGTEPPTELPPVGSRGTRGWSSSY